MRAGRFSADAFRHFFTDVIAEGVSRQTFLKAEGQVIIRLAIDDSQLAGRLMIAEPARQAAATLPAAGRGCASAIER